MKTRDKEIYTDIKSAVARMWQRHLESDSQFYMVQAGGGVVVTSKPGNLSGKIMASTINGRGCVR